MKKELKMALSALLLTSITHANNVLNSNASEPKQETQTSVKKIPVWAEEKAGTYRESRIGRLIFGACKKSPDLCMIIFHPDMNPDGTSAVKVFPPNQTPVTYQVKSCDCYTEETSEGPVERCKFLLSE